MATRSLRRKVFRALSSLQSSSNSIEATQNLSLSLLTEEEYHTLANSTIHDLLEKLEEYGDCVDIDGFDVDYGVKWTNLHGYNEVLTLKLGDLGTYVINKQTPNRQIWMSSPVKYMNGT
ncbi:frataxin, mitochondrial-like [Salvia splendens]|uniref:frataxin, mitochondrial-like n=1 Tax=Salvia splendens TaxID=180675 RepID=UPI001C27C9A5|nr:frataxin, mitochondrial-like [Salvia splendens]